MLRSKKAWVFLAPSLAGTAIFTLIPFGNVVIYSFCQAAGGRFVGMENFIQVWNNRAFGLAARNTLRFIVTCIPMLMAFSLQAAVLVQHVAGREEKTGRAVKGRGEAGAGAGIRQGSLYKTSILLPMAIPVASVVLLWKLMFYPQGLLNQVAAFMGGAARDWLNGKSAFGVLVFTYLWKNTGYDMMLWLAGLDGISRELYEAARVDGAGSLQSFWYVTVPGLGGTSFLVLVLSVVNSFKVFREAYLISGDYPHESIYMMQHLFNNWFVSLDIQKMSAASVILEAALLVPVLMWSGVRRRSK